MHADFWHQRWSTNQIHFHEGQTNRLLAQHLSALHLAPGQRVFVPLCGKSRDLPWLLTQGLDVVGIELSPLAVAQLFAELGVPPTITTCGPLERHQAPGLDVFVGDVFALFGEQLGAVDAVYDRAALVALPEPMRERYAAHLTAITQAAPQLLISIEYDQSTLAGPPFAVATDELERLYGKACVLQQLERRDVPGGLKGKVPATDVAWLLRRRD